MSTITAQNIQWFPACKTGDVPANGGVCVKYGQQQIALFHFSRRGVWYASQNECPHRNQMVLSRGMTGSQGEEPKIACPFHKKTFSLIDGRCMEGEEVDGIKLYPVRVEDEVVYIGIGDDGKEEAITV